MTNYAHGLYWAEFGLYKLQIKEMDAKGNIGSLKATDLSGFIVILKSYVPKNGY